MSEPFLAEVRLVGFNFPPRGWAFCDGQLLDIAQNTALFSLLGTTYGGDGRTNFALPDLRGRVPVHPGGGLTLGQRGGEENHTVSAAELPSHNHPLSATSAAGDNPIPMGRVLASYADGYATGSPTALSSSVVGETGGGQSHNNMQPALVVSFCIALLGLFPSRS